jgi:hypothetical protein
VYAQAADHPQRHAARRHPLGRALPSGSRLTTNTVASLRSG